MALTVEIGTVRGFVLDDPVAGVLDNTTYGLGGLNFIDVSDRVNTLGIRRGKNRDLDKFNAGNVSVGLINNDRFFDPVFGTAVDLIPRVPIKVTIDGADQFYGLVNDWNFDYEPGEDSVATVMGTDELTKLATQVLLSSGTAVVQDSGARVSAVLDMFTVDWPSDRRNIDTGVSEVEATLYEGQNALDYLQRVERSESGQLFIGKNGDLFFRSRSDAAPTSASLVKFADDGTGVPVRQFVVDYGSELMVNRVSVSNSTGTATAQNDLSLVTYGPIEESIDTVLEDNLDGLASYVVAKYGQPEYRFSGVIVNLDSLSTADRADVLGIEIGDVVQVVFTPNGVGTPIDKYGQVIGIEHAKDTGQHNVSFSLAAADFASLVLDDTVFGRLDVNTLGF
jgi:hypothetical protein